MVKLVGRRLSLVCVALGVACLAMGSPQLPGRAKVQDWLWDRLEANPGAEFFVILRPRADLSLAERLPNKEAKGWFVYQALTETAERTQAPLRAWLDARGIKYRSFFIVNAVLVEGGGRDLAAALAAREDVERVEGNPLIANGLPKPEAVDDRRDRPAESGGPGEAPEAVEWNISKTNAPGVWALGYQGQGIVVGGQDTGYRWTHEALKGKYRGWNGTTADHNYNWHDAVHSGGGVCGADSPEPCDDYGHGTHTMGTVLGEAGTNQVGMAPQAKWIGCRDMDGGSGSPATYLECFQFFLAPTRLDGTGADPSRAPDLTTNSWGCPASEGCSWDTLQAAVDAQKAAGIMTVAAAGNSGSSCGTITDPPAMYASAYTVGSTTNTDALSSFSSRGPASGTNLVKPDIVAPGSGVRSATNSSDTAYTSMSGTSMATPNVAGGVALLWSARPCLRQQQDATQSALDDSALKLTSIKACGGDYVTGPNNSWGYGRMDALAAVNAISCPVPGEVAPGGTAATAQRWTDKATQAWPETVGVGTYTLYYGLKADLPALLDSTADSCIRYQGWAAGTSGLNEDPSAKAGRFFWYLVTGSNATGEGPAGSASARVRVVNLKGAGCPP